MLVPVIWAGIFSYIASPVYKKIRGFFKGQYKTLACMITMIVFALCVLIPLSIIFSSVAMDVADFSVKTATAVKSDSGTELIGLINKILSLLPSSIGGALRNFLNDTEVIKSIVGKFANWSGSFLTRFSKVIVNEVSAFFLDFIIMTIVSFFLIRDGNEVMEYIKTITPLDSYEKDYFYRRAGTLADSVIFGVLFTVAIQAVLGGIGWHFAGLPNSSLFGLLMFFFGMFPAGTAIVWGPGALFLLLTGHSTTALLLFLWGCLVVSTVDNFLRPLIISGRHDNDGEIPTLLIILGLFGGVMAWGVIGIFLGPLALVLFMIIFNLYIDRCKKADSD